MRPIASLTHADKALRKQRGYCVEGINEMHGDTRLQVVRHFIKIASISLG